MPVVDVEGKQIISPRLCFGVTQMKRRIEMLVSRMSYLGVLGMFFHTLRANFRIRHPRS